MGAGTSKATTIGRGQLPSGSPYRMPDSADMQSNPLMQNIRTKIESELAKDRTPDQLQSMGEPAARFLAQRAGQLSERQAVGDELGGMGSMGGFGQQTAISRGGRGRNETPGTSRGPRNAEKRERMRSKMKERRASRARSQARGRV